MNSLQDFIVSKVRVKMFQLFFANPDQIYYVREITRLINEEINAVRRELLRMSSAKILKPEKRANRVYYALNKNYLFYQELQQMVFKSNNFTTKLLKLRKKLGDIKYAMCSDKFIFNKKDDKNLDILIIGEVVLKELEVLIREEERRLDREINYTVFDETEFNFRKKRNDPFLMDILYHKKIMLIGNEEDFIKKEISYVK
jgi:hypothetical protein